ncbi:MAG TPA: hypothetical protein VGO57_10750 [Verrucomicrobiae bacterium]|jgi:hypothetical protein
MMRLSSLFLVGALMLCGCSHTPPSAPTPASVAGTTPAKTEQLSLRNNAVSLLYDLLQDEKNVNKVLLIKHNSAEVGRLIDAISHTSGDASKRLDQMAKADPALSLHALELPAGEKATREAIAHTKEHELLFSSGTNFQFQLLLTQTDALSYGWHLSRIAAENSKSPEQVRAFTQIADSLENLYGQVITQLKAEAKKTG